MHIDTHLNFKFLVKELTRVVLYDLDVPLNKLFHQIFKVTKVLCILVDQISITDFPLLIRVHAILMVGNPVLQLVIHRETIVLFNTKLIDVNGDSWVHLCSKLLQVGAGVVEVGFQSSLLDQSSKLGAGVVKMIAVGLQVLVGLLEQHGVVAKRDYLADHL